MNDLAARGLPRCRRQFHVKQHPQRAHSTSALDWRGSMGPTDRRLMHLSSVTATKHTCPSGHTISADVHRTTKAWRECASPLHAHRLIIAQLFLDADRAASYSRLREIATTTGKDRRGSGDSQNGHGLALLALLDTEHADVAHAARTGTAKRGVEPTKGQ